MDGRSKVDYDSIEYRKKLWEKEYGSRKALPSTNTFNPSSSLRKFLKKYPDIKKDYALDIGCGNGRNSMYLIDNGFKSVLAIDLSEKAIEIANTEKEKSSKYSNIEYIAGDVAEVLDTVNERFDLIIDMTVMHSLTEESRKRTVKHIKRLLKPNSYFLIFTLMADSPAVIDLKAKFPGSEPNSYRFKYENDVISEKAFTLNELKELFKPLKLVEYEQYQTVTRAFKGEFPRIYITCLFKNTGKE